jgi:hypothetical protein
MGRPRKRPKMDSAVSPTSIKDASPKRGPGRPRKDSIDLAVSPTKDASPKRGLGRPRGPGRPRKDLVDSAVSPTKDASPKRGPGRWPKKHPVGEQVPAEAPPESPPKRGRGRPRKNPVELVQGPTPGREDVEPIPSRKRGRQHEEPSEGDNTQHALQPASAGRSRRQRRSQTPKRIIDSVYDVEIPTGRVIRQRQARGIDFGMINQEQPQIRRKSIEAQKSPADHSASAVHSVTSETSIPQRRQRRAPRRFVDESVEPGIPTEIINSSEQVVTMGDSAELNSVEDARDAVEEQPSKNRRSKRQKR